jgi:ABC-type sugar transport system permease subunit
VRFSRALLLFPLPALVLYGAFFVLPAAQGLQYAATDWDGFSPDYQNVGVTNFQKIATADDLFRHALGNNLKFMLTVVVGQTALALLLAVLLDRPQPGLDAAARPLLPAHRAVVGVRGVRLEVRLRPDVRPGQHPARRGRPGPLPVRLPG